MFRVAVRRIAWEATVRAVRGAVGEGSTEGS
jgi:hypothetical protein